MKTQFIAILLIALIVGSEAAHLSKNSVNNNKANNQNNQSQIKHKNKTQKPTSNKEELLKKYHTDIQISVSSEAEEKAQVQAQNQVKVEVEAKAQNSQSEDVVGSTKTQENEIQALAKQSATFQEFYAALKALLKDHLKALQEQRAAKDAECTAYSNTIDQLNADIVKTEDYIRWLTEKVAENLQKIEKIFEERCEAHGIFIEYYKNAKVTLRLIEFLKVAINNYDMIQLKQVGNILTEFMNPRLMTNPDAIKTMLVQLKQVGGLEKYDDVGDSLDDQEVARTSEEIGDDHVDDGRERINVEQFESSERRVLGSYKEEITNLLNTMATNIKAEIDRRQNDEIELNDRVVEFVEKMEIENQHLNMEADNMRESLIVMREELESTTYLLETCRADLKWLDDVIAAQQELITWVDNNQAELEKSYLQAHSAKSVQIQSSDQNAKSANLKETSQDTTGDATGGDTQNGTGGDTGGDTQNGTGGDTGGDTQDGTGETPQEEKVYDDTTNWDPKNDESIVLESKGGQGIKIPDIALNEGLVIGVSWDTQNDIDSNIIVTNASHQVVERIYWDNSESSDDMVSIVYNGDARGGAEAGDDETSDIYLNDCDPSYEHISVLVTLYDDDTYFQDVYNCQVRVYVNDTVFVEYYLDPKHEPLSENASAVFLVEFYRNHQDNSNWYIKPMEIWAYTDPVSTVELRGGNQNMIDFILEPYGNGTALPVYAKTSIA